MWGRKLYARLSCRFKLALREKRQNGGGLYAPKIVHPTSQERRFIVTVVTVGVGGQSRNSDTDSDLAC